MEQDRIENWVYFLGIAGSGFTRPVPPSNLDTIQRVSGMRPPFIKWSSGGL